MRNTRSLIAVLLLLLAVPAMAVFTGMDLDATLSNLRRELYHDYRHISGTQEQLQDKYERQHQRMVDIVKKCNDLSLMLYSQKQDYTFDIAYALEKVTKEYNDFNKNRTPYDRIVSGLDFEISRYARLIESLRRLPPELTDLEVLPDSLAYHNDTLDAHLMQNAGLLQQELSVLLDSLVAMSASSDSLVDSSVRLPQTVPPIPDLSRTPDPVDPEDSVVVSAENPAFILSESGQADRDSCLYYASELLKMYAKNRELVMADSTHYREAQLRMQESYDYARDYYGVLHKNVFVVGQTSWLQILAHPSGYWEEVRSVVGQKFAARDLNSKVVYYESVASSNDSRVQDFLTLVYLLLDMAAFFVLWGLSALLLLPLYRFVKPVDSFIAKEQRPYVALLLACVLFIILSTEASVDDRAAKSVSLMHTFIWLLMAITASLILRLKPSKLKQGITNYLPTIFTALFVISCRVLFLPNALMNFFFPPLLLLMTIWQLVANLRRTGDSDRSDIFIAWASLAVTAIATLISWCGYIFLALIILVWWYFLLAFLLSIAAILDMLSFYRVHRLERKVQKYKEKVSYVPGPAQKSLMFSVTWFHDLVKEVLVPLLALSSIPICIRLALEVFEFNDLYHRIFETPFLHQGKPDGFRVSLNDVLFLSGLFFVFCYLNKAVHTLWQHSQYQRFLRKYKRKAVRSNEINLSLGNSLITVFVWFVFVDFLITKLHIPTDSLGLVAGGLSAGIGLALKDIINNFIYGIQLMGGRLRVGDWIECDGVRGKVSDINYQTTLVETIEGTQVAFLNSSLFGKNFTNLTRNNSYELTTITVGVAYGTDFQHLRELLEKGLEPLKTKDAYGRDVVDPARGIYIRFGDFGDSAVNVLVKQYVLQPERIAYIEKCKELVYKTLNEGGITIPFPQCDVHVIDDNK